MKTERIFNEARQSQGFKSQSQLDAFYEYFDHSQSCPDCQRVGHTWIDDGCQPYKELCEFGKKLQAIYDRY